jgi:hypothetical protein
MHSSRNNFPFQLVFAMYLPGRKLAIRNDTADLHGNYSQARIYSLSFARRPPTASKLSTM